MNNEQLTSTRPSKLPESWVQRIFATMQGHYGTRFLNLWKTGQTLPDGRDAGVVNAMNHWAEKLAGYSQSPDTIKRALESLPVEPPSLPQFQEILRHAYRPPEVPQLENKWTEEQLERNRMRVRELLEQLNLTNRIKEKND